MELFPNTDKIWEIDTGVGALRFIEALGTILQVGDVLVFGAYEPTPELTRHLIATGAIQKREIPDLYTSFDFNRGEHPNGCAFELPIASNTLESLIRPGPGVLRQRDKDSFFDHFVAYRPTVPKTPLLNFHAAFCGGTLVLSGIFDESAARRFSSRIEGSITIAENPYFVPPEDPATAP